MADSKNNDGIGEIVNLLKDYARQETVGPLKNVGRYLGYGISGAICIGVGMIMLGIGALRAFQGEPEVDANGLITDDGAVFSQNLSWLPYLIVFAGMALVAGFLASRITNKRELDD